MGWATDLLAVIGTGAAGAATGGLFSIVSALFKGVRNYFAERQRQQFRREEWEHEKVLLELEMQRNDRDTENELRITETEGSWRGLGASYNSVIASSAVHKWVNDVRALFRPALTTGLFVLVYVIYDQLMGILQGDEAALFAAFSPEEAGESIRFIVTSVVYTACTAGVWWFGDRALSPRDRAR